MVAVAVASRGVRSSTPPSERNHRQRQVCHQGYTYKTPPTRDKRATVHSEDVAARKGLSIGAAAIDSQLVVVTPASWWSSLLCTNCNLLSSCAVVVLAIYLTVVMDFLYRSVLYHTFRDFDPHTNDPIAKFENTFKPGDACRVKLWVGSPRWPSRPAAAEFDFNYSDDG
jgi:hypothetical protein